MLIVPEQPENFYAPVKITLTYRGKPISISIRPLDGEKEIEIGDASQVFEALINPETKRLERVGHLDKHAYFENLADHVVADFSGVGGSKKEPWPVDRKHKVMLLSITPRKGEAPIWSQVREKAVALAASLYAKMAETAEAEEKN